MAGPVVGYLVKKIGDSLIEEVLFLRDVDKEMSRLQFELQRMESFLKDADRKRNSDESVNNWVKDVRRVAYEAEDLVESFALEEENRRRGSSRGRISWFRFPGRHKFGREIQLLVESIHDIATGRQRYGIADLSAGDGGKRHVDGKIADRRHVAPHTPDSDVVGMEDEKKAILDLLLAEKEKQRSVVSIEGMGGLGKSTLAKKVFKDSLIKSHFDLAVWIDVSQQYTREDLLRKLYMEVTKKKRKEVEEMTREEVERNLYESLQPKKYLIFMDDVWDEEVWVIFKNGLPDEGNGSRVLITTRSQKVAKAAAAQPSAPRNLRVLNDEEGWELFLRKAFPNEDGKKACQGEFENVGKEIVKKCGGLPLAVVVVGGLLSKKGSLREWDMIAKTMVWQHEEKGKECMKILALSYADLPPHLKWCFLYLGVFAEDFEIEVGKLIRLWIAEGFVERREDITLEEVAMDYLNEIISRCLIQVVKESVGRTEPVFCRIHDLLRELAILESRDLDFFHFQQKALLDHQTSLDSSLRRFSFHGKSEFLSQRHSTPRLRTLLGFKLTKESKVFPTCVWPLIRVIDLEGAPIKVVSEEVGELANLRYLGLRDTGIKSLPTSVQKLSRLQSLDVRDNPIWKMNSVVWKIEALRHILVPLHMDMDGIQQGSLRNLQVLEQAHAGDWMRGCLSRLTNLRKLRLEWITEVYHQDLSDALPELSCLTTLELEGLSLPVISLMLSNLDNLQSVKINGQIQSPQPFKYQWPSRLSTLILDGTRLDQDPLPSLGTLTDLRVLKLLHNAYTGREMICPCDSFPQLRRLKLIRLTHLEEWKVDDRAMTRLQSLSIINCEELMKLPQGLKGLANLEELFLSLMSTLLYARVQEENGEDWENIKHIPSITIPNV